MYSVNGIGPGADHVEVAIGLSQGAVPFVSSSFCEEERFVDSGGNSSWLFSCVVKLKPLVSGVGDQGDFPEKTVEVASTCATETELCKAAREVEC